MPAVGTFLQRRSQKCCKRKQNRKYLKHGMRVDLPQMFPSAECPECSGEQLSAQDTLKVRREHEPAACPHILVALPPWRPTTTLASAQPWPRGPCSAKAESPVWLGRTSAWPQWSVFHALIIFKH